MPAVKPCRWCGAPRWQIGDSGVLICLACDLTPTSQIPNHALLRKWKM